ncbi:MAG: fibronectin type III domain-containing protein, partial [Candidatus Omnitrophota bacterium]
IYDIPTGIERKITGEGGLPDIYDKNIVWRGYGDNGYGETYFYDLSKEKELRITDNMTYETLPRVYENTIAWFHFNSPDDWPVPTHLCVAKVFFVPRIISIEPAEILPGALLIIEGIDFGYDKADSQVRFVNGAAAGIETWSNVRITCRVPKNAKSGPLKVVTKGGNSNPIDVTILIPPPLPAAPKGLTGAVISGSQIDLRWEKGIVTDIVSLFKIERKDTYNGPYKEIASVPGSQLTYSNTGLGCGTNYYYRVRAMNSTGYSGCSNILVISIPTLPASPKNLTAAATTFYGQPLVRLKWSEPLPPGDKIYIERKTGSGGTYGVIAEVSAMTVLKYDDYKVTKGTKYYYRVRSRNINGYSAYSNEASVN